MKTANLLISETEGQQIITLSEMAVRSNIPLEHVHEISGIALHLKQKIKLAFKEEEQKEIRLDVIKKTE
mgnify:CR=1 FL=1